MTNVASSNRALTGLRVLEIADEKGEYCGKLLADMGAEVIKVEPVAGSKTRQIPPFSDGENTENTGLFFLYCNSNKKSITLDLETMEGRRQAYKLALSCDIVIETLAPGRMAEMGLGYEDLRQDNPSLVMTSITGFGQTGPHSHFRTSDIVASAMGGAMGVTGWPDDPPVVLAGQQSYIVASVYGAASSLIALNYSIRTGQGQHVDISIQEAMLAVTSICGVGKWLDDGIIPQRYGSGLFSAVPSGTYPCLDGKIYLIVNRPKHWQVLARWVNEVTGNQEILDPMFEGPSSCRQPYRELLDIFIQDMTRQFNVEDFYHEAQRRHLAVSPLNDAFTVTHDAQLNARNFYVQAENRRGHLTYPGPPYRFSRTPWSLKYEAPLIGEHNELLEHIKSVKPALTSCYGKAESTALGGLRVVEFTAGMAGPWIGRHMAHAGADVIKVESLNFPDVTRLYVPPKSPEMGVQPQLSPWFTDWNAGKRFVALDLTKTEGVKLARELVAKCDVVIDNNSTGVLEKLGLGFDELSRIKPDLILLSSTGYGDTGPCKSYVSWGPNIETASALSYLSGFSEQDCTMTQFAFPDPISALHGLFAVMCALNYRDKTGKGQRINLSQMEATIASFGHIIMEAFSNNQAPVKIGNGSLRHAPQGCYPCEGGECWCVLTIETESQWQKFCEISGRQDWATDPRFHTLEARLIHRADLDLEIARWTEKQDPYHVMERLQLQGIAAGVVQNAEDQMMRDSHLSARRYFERISHKIKGSVVAPSLALGLTAPSGKTTDSGRAVGSDNREVFCGLVGLSEDKYESLVQSGIIES